MGQGPPETPQKVRVERNGRHCCVERGCRRGVKAEVPRPHTGASGAAGLGGACSGRGYGEGQAALSRKALNAGHSLDFIGNEFL